MLAAAPRFARRLGASLAAGAAAATMVHLASDERKRKSRCSAAAAGAPATGVSEVVGELEKQEEPRGAGKRSRPARKVTNQVSGTAAQRAFFTKEMSVMGLPLRASEAVADSALYVAADRISRMLREQPASVLERLALCGACVHIIGEHQGTSDLPEHQHMKGVDGGYTGEKGVTLDQRARGMGGLQTSCGEENLLDLDSDPRYAGRDILTHEFAHLLMDYGLPPALREEIRATHKRVTETTRRWQRADGELAYAGSNASEYWAELSMWYFGSHGEYVDRQARVPPPGCHALAEYDPDGFRLLGRIYGGTHPLLRSDAVAPVARLSPAAAAAVSGGGDEESELPPVTLHFANLRGAADAELWWVDPQGEAHRYGCVAAGGRASQQTYATHVWEVRPTEGRGKPARYMAGYTEGSCDVAADCFGMSFGMSKGQSAQGG